MGKNILEQSDLTELKTSHIKRDLEITWGENILEQSDLTELKTSHINNTYSSLPDKIKVQNIFDKQHGEAVSLFMQVSSRINMYLESLTRAQYYTCS